MSENKNSGKNNACLTQNDLLIMAGINPKTGLPTRVGSKSNSANSIKNMLKDLDREDACNRYVWYNLPCNLTSQELERLLYYKGQLCFFYDKNLNEFYFMPYALDGTIDFYGRYNSIHPVPMTSGTDESLAKNQAAYLSSLKLKCVYGMKLPEEVTQEVQEGSAVILRDYINDISQTTIARSIKNDGLLDIMSKIIPYLDMALLNSTGVKGVRVPDEDSAKSLMQGTQTYKEFALKGIPWIPLEGKLDFQELSGESATKVQDFMLAMQSLDNFRLSTYGIDNGGLFEKKAHELQSEADINGGPVGLVLQDGLSIRQNFCNIVNSIWGVGIWCEPAQNVSGIDNDGDGSIHEDNSDGANTGISTDTEEEVEND